MMELFLLILALIWLGIVSWFDLRTKQVPHSAWVIVPFGLAILYRIAYSSWELVVLSIIIAFASERNSMAKAAGNDRFASLFMWLPLVVVTFLRASVVNPVGAVAILVFWIAWELRCWGGADAVASITLVLLWPDMSLILALLGVHMVAALVATIVTLVRERTWKLHAIPGLPLLLLTVLLREAFVRVPISIG
jgi:Flp pilus assembly protein protease CpaA